MLAKEIIHLLDLKNNALGDFAYQNSLFLKLAQRKPISIKQFRVFYSRREEILQKISKIDTLMDQVCSYTALDFIEAGISKDQIRSCQKIKKNLVTQIIGQDLEIISIYSKIQQLILK